jgi:hypothetical protein
MPFEAQKGRRGMTPLNLNFGTIWRWVINLRHRLRYLREKHGKRELDGHSGGSGYAREHWKTTWLQPLNFQAVLSSYIDRAIAVPISNMGVMLL